MRKKSFQQSRPDEYKYKKCSNEGCEAKYDNHHWGAKKAQREGWFLQKDGQRWCPDHNPEWVAEWRRKRSSASD